MKPGLVWLALALAATPTLLRAAEAPAAKPNIVYILADDLGYGDVQTLNPQRGKIATPHLDRLARQGMIFTDAHSGSSVCTPTRYGILTGRYAWRTRLQRGVLDGGNDEPLIAADRLTVPGFLKQQGYRTACIGKWHLGFIAQPPASDESRPAQGKKTRGGGRTGAAVGATIVGGPVTRGFDEFFGCSNARTMSSLIDGDKVVEQVEPVEVLPRLARRAVAFIEQQAAAARGGQPFFLYLPLTSPHTPIVPAREWQGRSPLGAYGDFVMQTDAVVGEVLAALERSGLAEQTLVIFTADNGCSPQAGTGKLEAHGHFASERYRGYKSDIWEGGHRVPFLVRWPGVVPAASRSDQTICLTDLMATCADILGARLPDNAAEDSVSLLPLLRPSTAAAPDPSSRRPAAEARAIVHHSIAGRFAIREGRWKLCLCAGSGGWSPGGGKESPQLYDLAADASEGRNLASAHPDIVARLTRRLESLVAEGRSTPGARQTNDVQVKIIAPDGAPMSKKR